MPSWSTGGPLANYPMALDEQDHRLFLVTRFPARLIVLETNHGKLCARSDKPVAALIKDLKRRGLLDSTLVVWGGEFGRTPMSEGTDGRDHNPYGFSMFLAGGGVKPGVTVGTTDEFGLKAIEDKVHVHDLHATILHLMGVDHKRLTFFRDGRDERLTVNGGSLIRKVLA